MKQPKQALADDRRKQIIAGALRVFSTKGYLTATNKEIALAAGINSPGLIYHYFEDKAALLRAVIETYAPPVKMAVSADGLLSETLDGGLTLFARAYFSMMGDDDICAGLRVLIGEALRDQGFAKVLGDIAPLRMISLITLFLERKRADGALVCDDCETAAWSFVGGLFVHVFARNILGIGSGVPLDYERIVQSHVSTFLAGVAVRGDKP
ncbi:MAG TPA: TetR/AcrR family transcriptional regulator [Capsulimonadaceae bacterium]|jgi:AcrR family transcriptional regulator